MFRNDIPRKTSKHAGKGREISKRGGAGFGPLAAKLRAICCKSSAKKPQISGDFGVIGNKHTKNSDFCGPSLVTKAGFCVVFGGRQW